MMQILLTIIVYDYFQFLNYFSNFESKLYDPIELVNVKRTSCMRMYKLLKACYLASDLTKYNGTFV